jgi:hypothetical protein
VASRVVLSSIELVSFKFQHRWTLCILIILKLWCPVCSDVISPIVIIIADWSKLWINISHGVTCYSYIGKSASVIVQRLTTSEMSRSWMAWATDYSDIAVFVLLVIKFLCFGYCCLLCAWVTHVPCSREILACGTPYPAAAFIAFPQCFHFTVHE